MFLKRLNEFRRTLAFRLTLWYAGIFTLSSCLAFLFFYVLIADFIQERTDQELLRQVKDFSQILNLRGVETVKRVAVREAQAAGEKKVFFRLLYANGSVFSSSNMSYWQTIDIGQNAIRQLINGSPPIFETINVFGHDHKVRVLYGMLSPQIILQLGISMEGYTRFIEAFRRISLFTMSLLLVVAALIGWFMARRALTGVGNVTRTARHISEGTLKERVPVNTRGDEIDQLAETFNQMLDRIEQLVSGIKEMSDNIAHDLRSPITRIRGLAEVTLTSGQHPDDYQQMAASTIEECDRLLHMINTMLVISKTEAGIDEFEFKKIQIDAIVKDACELFQPAAAQKNINLKCKANNVMAIKGDVGMIQRMVANLLDNAIKYSTPGSIVELKTEPALKQQMNLVITDSGVGIAPQDLPHIFERFYRCDESRSLGGVGLGLSLARAIARVHGGDIMVTSKPGKGSTFTVTLPLVDIQM